MLSSMARRQPPKTGITDWISDVTDVFRPGPRPNEMRQVTQFRDTTRNVVQTGAAAIDTTFSGGLAGSFYRNIQQPSATIASPNVRSRAEREGLGRFGRDVATTAATAAVGGAAVRGAAKGLSAIRASGIPARATASVSGAFRKEIKTMPVSKVQKKYKVSEPYSGYNWDTIGENSDFWEGPLIRRQGQIDSRDMDELTRNIQEIGITQPVRVSGNRVIDGHHRIYAASNIDPKFPVPVERLDIAAKKSRGGGKNKR
jgi:hypothetical protein